jgi:hypothetical protein
MMQSILSLINETLTTSSSAASENAHEAPKSGTRGEFESMLTREDTSARTSATRIKARSNSIEENGDDVSADDESDDEDATTCVNVDDYAAWGITHTIAAPPPSMKNPSVSMVAVKMPSKASPAPQPLPALHTAGETIPAAALAPKTQEFAAPITQELAAVSSDMRDTIAPSTAAPNSSAITREFPTPTAAARTQELPVAQQMSAFIEKMARSKNATDIPPPSAIPMVSGAPPANANASNHVSAPQNHAPTIDLHGRTSSAANDNNHASKDNSSGNNTNANTKGSTKSDDDAAPMSTTVGSFANDAPADAALRPTVLLNAFDLRMPSTPTRALSTMDIQNAMTTEGRQQAADRAVNQMTLSRAADGELNIPELGRVRVEAQTRDGAVDVRITADRAETQELVSGHTHEIVIDAKAAAIPIVDLRVKLDPRAEPQTNFASSQDSSNRRDARRDSDETSEKQANPARGMSRARFVL